MIRVSGSSAVVMALALLLATPALAFNFPLSDEAIREAYFLGQRRDVSMNEFLARYKKALPVPDSGPQISSVEFLTPFAQLILVSSRRANYSAQQAAQEHRGAEEIVAITIQVQLTPSYGAFTAAPASSQSGSPTQFTLRSSDFWKDIGVQVVMDDKVLEPTDFTGEANYGCSREGGGCVLTGATLRIELPAKLFTSNSTTVVIDPPEGPEVSVDFNLVGLR